MTRILCIALLALTAIAFAAPAAQAQYTIEQTTKGGYNTYIKGQSFTPNVGIAPDPGSVSVLDLTAITLTRSMQTWAGPTSHFYLNIYDDDPVNGSGNFIGSSTNTIDVSKLADYKTMKWTFSYLTLDYNHKYFAMISSTDTDGGLDVYCGMRECGPDLYPGGNAIAGSASNPWDYIIKGNDLAFKIELADEHILTADSTLLYENTAGDINFEIDAGSGYAGRTYLLAMSVSGNSPGTTLPGGQVLPINWDFATELAIAWNNLQFFHDFWGTLDGSGKAHPRFEWPGHPGTGGAVLYFAACTANPFDVVTHSWTVAIHPEPTTPSKTLYVAYANTSDIFKLGKVDYADPESMQTIGTLGKRLFRALEFAGNGKLYGYESPLWGPGQLFEVNPANAALTPIGPTTSQRVDGMAYNPVDGKMYGVEASFGGSKLHTIDLSTGAVTLVGTITDDGPVGGNWMAGIGIDDEGHIYLYNNSAYIEYQEQGIFKSKVPGGLDYEMIHDLGAEFGLTNGLQTPAPLFVDWSADYVRSYGFLRQWLGGLNTGWYSYHFAGYGVGWTLFPLYPLQNTMLYAWTAPPSP